MSAGIEMASRRSSFRIRAIAEFVNVKAVLARREPRDVRGDFHAIARCGESDGAGYVAAGCGMQRRDGFRSVAGTSNCGSDEENCER